MKTALKNLTENKKVSIVAKKDKRYFRINGDAAVYEEGKFLETAIKRSDPPLPHHAIVIKIKEIFDLDKVKRIL